MSKRVYDKVEGLLHGGDYNPEQWLDHPEILKEDIQFMKQAGINCVTLGVFSWSTYEPEEGVYHFQWLKEVMDNLYANGIYTILATPTGARPAWLDQKYPECMRVDSMGVRYHHGVRHNHCMSAPVFREKAAVIITKLMEAVGDHPGLIMFHVNNEFGGECFCPHCVDRFQKYLANKFDNHIEDLNKAWWTTFWSHTYNSFEQIEPPFANGEFSIMGLNLEWKRFTTWSMTDYMKFEIQLLKEKRPDIPVTTNFMKLYDGLDYREMAKELDLVSWDSYPAFHNDGETLFDTLTENSFDHVIVRSMKKEQPFLLMESCPGPVNWHPFNKVKRPGIHELAGLQAIACGSDSVQYFQIRKGRGSYEQYHGAVIDHLGTSDTRVFKEVEALGEKLAKIKEIQGSVLKPKVALIYDWDTRWAIAGMKGLADETKQYDKTCYTWYRQLVKLCVDVDIVPQTEDMTEYSLILAPMMYLLKPGVGEKLTSFVENGGVLLASYLTGYVDEHQLCYLGGFPGQELKELFGIISEEIDTLYPKDENHVALEWNQKALVKDYCEVLRVQDAKVLGTYEEDYYGGMAALTVKEKGKGAAYYVAARMDDASMKELLRRLCTKAQIPVMNYPDGMETHVRYGEAATYRFIQNDTEFPQKVVVEPALELLTGMEVSGEVIVDKFGTLVLKYL